MFLCSSVTSECSIAKLIFFTIRMGAVTVLEYVRGLLGLGWLYSPLVLGLIRDKGRLLKGQVSLAWKSSKPLYIRR